MTPTRALFDSISRPVREVPLLGAGSVFVRALTVAEMRRLSAKASEIPAGPGRDERAGLWLCLFALSECDGSAMFPEPTAADIEQLESKPSYIVDAIAEAAAGINRPDKVASKN
jgi:hypothetical protein